MVLLLLALPACTDGAVPRTPRATGPNVEDNAPTNPPGQEPDPGDDDDEPDCVPATGVVLNEVSPSNVALLVDTDGDTADWVELYNPGTVPVALEGWTLSDDKDLPQKWTFPAVTLEPGAFRIVYASGKADRTRVVASWDTRIDEGDAWRYLEVLQPPDPSWAQPGFDDSAWLVGPSGFGTDDGDDATELDGPTVYVRTTFDVSATDLADLTALYLHVDYDDAFVAYLNGVELVRADIGSPGTPPAWDELAPSSHEALMYQELPPSLFNVAGSIPLLTEGANTLALEVHDTVDSSDLSLVPFLTLGFRTDATGIAAEVLQLPTVELHTNFSLKAMGERVRLYDPAGCEADDFDPGPLYADQSYGRQPDGDGALGYFMEPTPGAPNVTESRPGFAATPTFDPPPGHFPGGVEVTVVASPLAATHVSWEGWEPTESDPLYTAPLPTGTDREAVVLRARSWQDGLWPSRIGSATYILRERGTLPVVALVTDPPNLWDDEIGIYAFGTEFEPLPPYKGANFLRRDWERPVHLSQWEPDGSLGYAVDAGIAIHGGYSRRYEQKSFLVKLGSGYGEDTIEHEVFPGLGIDEFDRLLLRNAGNDWHGCYSAGCAHGAHFRDGLMARIATPAGVDKMAHRPAELYLNGEFWGLYQINERPDASFVASHHGEEDIDLLDENADPVEGDANHYLETMEFLRTSDLTDPAIYAQVGTRIDLDELISYLVLEFYYGNIDWPNHNIKYWRPRTADGRWRWLLYDTDVGLGQWGNSPAEDHLARVLLPNEENPEWSTELFRLLVQSPEFSDAFLNRYADLLNTALVPEVTRAALHQLEGEMALDMPRQLERWGMWTDGVTEHSIAADEWQDQIEWIDDWLGARPDHARQHLVTHFGLAGTWTLDLASDPPGAGSFAVNTVTVDGPFSGVYFRGVPVTVTAVPAAGYTFSGWSDPSLPNTTTVTLEPGAALTLSARFD